MAEEYILIIYLIWSILELFNVNLILKSFLNMQKKELSLPELFIKSGFYILIITGYIYWVEMGYRNVIISLIFCALVIIKSAILLSSFYKIKVSTMIVIAFFVELVSFIGFNITLLIHKITSFSISYSIFDEIWGEIFLLLLLINLLLLKKRNVITVWINELTVIDLSLFIVIFFNAGIIESKFLKKPTFTFEIRLVIVTLVISVMILIVKSIIITEKKNSLEYVNYLLEEKMQLSTDYYKELTERDNQVKKFRHDIKNHLLVLHAIIKDGENERAISYIEELQEECMKSKKKYETGNYIADAILSAKDAKAKEKNIIIQYEGIMPSELISDADIVVVLSNVVDNAIEACEKVVGERKIKIKSVLTKSIWILYTENPSIKTHIGNINKIQTSKSDKRIHGFGLQNIERTAKKYNGEMSIKYNNGVFKSKIVFMLDKRGNNDKNSNM